MSALQGNPLSKHWRRYPSYKDSGVEWLGEVPEGWDIDRLKFSINSIKNGIWGEEPGGIDDLICIRVADFDRVKLCLLNHDYTLRSISKSDRNERVLQNGNLLIEKSGGGENQPVGIVVCYSLNREAVCSNFVSKLVINAMNDSKYMTYLFAHLYSLLVNTRSIKQTTGIQNLDTNAYFNERVCYPPLPEQHAIAAFLDHETARIDALIEKKERLIALLEEKRTALIGHAVTKGLDPSVKMKDSGIEWIGMVPEGWVMLKLKKCVCIKRGQIDPEKQTYRNCILIAPNHIESSTGRLLFTETAEEQSAESGKYFFENDDVLYSKIRPHLKKACFPKFKGLCSADPIFRRSKIKNNIFHTAAPANQVFSSNHQLNWIFSLSFSPPQQQNIPSPSGTGKRPISKLVAESASSSG